MKNARPAGFMAEMGGTIAKMAVVDWCHTAIDILSNQKHLPQIGAVNTNIGGLVMKFEYNGTADKEEMVAFIDVAGDLCIKGGECVIYFLQGGEILTDQCSSLDEYAQDNGVRKAFYPGDKITITF